MRIDSARLGRIGGAAGVAVTVALLIGGCGSQKSSSPPSQTAVALAPAQSIRSFVTPPYAEGVPYDQARSFGQGAVPELVTLLSEPTMADSRSNIVVALGMIGGDTAETELRNAVARGTGKLSDQEYRLRLDAQMSLGYAANLATNGVTETYLRSSLEAAMWAATVSWQSPDGEDPFTSLRERTVIALGLSGKPRAKLALQDLLTSGGAGGGGRGGSHQLTPEDKAVITEAIKVNDYLSTHSLSQYFREYR